MSKPKRPPATQAHVFVTTDPTVIAIVEQYAVDWPKWIRARRRVLGGCRESGGKPRQLARLPARSCAPEPVLAPDRSKAAVQAGCRRGKSGTGVPAGARGSGGLHGARRGLRTSSSCCLT